MQAFTQLIQNEEHYRKMGQNARSWIETNFDASKNGKQLVHRFYLATKFELNYQFTTKSSAISPAFKSLARELNTDAIFSKSR